MRNLIGSVKTFAGFTCLLTCGILFQAFGQGTYYESFSITGSPSVCINSSTVYTYSGPVELTWSVQGGNFVGSNVGQSVQVQWDAASNSLSATGQVEDCWYDPEYWPPQQFCNTTIYTSNAFSVSSVVNGGYVTGSTTLCTPGSGSLTLSGHVGTILRWEYKVGAGSWTNITNASTTQGFSELTVSTDYRALLQNSSCTAYSSLATVSISPTSVGGTVSGTTTLCSPGSGTLNLTGHTGSVQRWEYSIGGAWIQVTPNNTTATLNYSGLTATTLYRAIVKSGVCPVTESSVATVTIQSPPVGGSLSGSTLCIPASGSLTLTGYSGTIVRWEYLNGSTWTAIPNTTSPIYSYYDLTTNTSYRVVVGNGVCSTVNSSVGVINVTPESVGGTLGPSVDVNSPTATGTLTLSTPYSNIQRWEYSTGGLWTTISSNTGSTYNYNVSQSTSYRVVTKNGVCPEANSNVAVINIAPPNQACAGQSNAPPSPEKNFIRTERVLVNGITKECQLSALPEGQKNTAFMYFDGAGRKLQEVTVKVTPAHADFVQPHVYDNLGREPREYLPYTNLTEAGGKFRSAAATAQMNYYAEPPTAVAASTVGPYKDNFFEASPLGRVIEVASPRDDFWNSTAKKSTAYVKLNIANEVPYWKDFVSGIPQRSGFHPANTIQVKESIDEEGKVTRQYTNFQDKVVMTRIGKGTEWFDTHFIYSPTGLLMKVLQPEGVARLTNEFDGATDENKRIFMDRWMFQFQYDGEQREKARRVPGYAEDSVGWHYTVYDKWNRIVLTQDPHQRTRNEYSFLKYDRFNRSIMTGIHVVTGTTLATLRTSAANSSVRYETQDPNASGYSVVTGYTLTATFPSVAESDLRTVTYYDNYDFLINSGWDAEANSYSFVSISGFPQSSELLTSIKGHTTGSKVRIVGGGLNTWLNSVTRYDKNYRAIQDIKEHHLGGTIRSTVLYDFVGNVMKEHLYNQNASLTVQSRYVYDHAGRLSALYHQTNSQPEILSGSYKYNEIGQLMEKNIHSTDGTTFLQSVDYRYNIKGWLTNINNSAFVQGWSNDDTNDKFGMELQYYVESPVTVGSTGDQLQQKSLYDGNISAVKWRVDNNQDPPEERIFVFDTDVLSRLKQAHYAKNSQSWYSPAWNGDSGLFDEVIAGYDKNGNLKVTDVNDNPGVALTRFGKIQSSKGIVDQLKLGYRLNGKHSNRLIDVDDNGNGSLGFVPASASITEEYQYYNNGNTKFDHNKGISNVVYNHLNLVQEIEFTRPPLNQIDKIEYTYDAFGNKLSRVVKKNGVQVWRADYVGEMQYDNGSLSFFATKEGRVVKNNTTYDYEYFHKDHQGNIRMVYGALKETKTYRATMEDPVGNPTLAQKEQESFKNLPSVRHTHPSMNYTPSSQDVLDPDKSAKLNGYSDANITSTPVGPSLALTVSNGDKVYMETYAKYTQVTGSNGVLATAALVSAFTSPFGIINSGETATLYQSFNSNLAGVSAARGSSTTIPKGYLVWLFFNSSYQFVNAGGQSITSAAYNSFEKLSLSFTANQNGYLYVYVANESNVNADASVYFDETYIVHEKNNLTLQVLQASDYYPFGLSFNQFQADRLKEVSTGNYVPELRNRYMLQSQELQKDLDLSQYQFQWRMYDPTIGRWSAVDPLALERSWVSPYNFVQNNPLNRVDPTGAIDWIQDADGNIEWDKDANSQETTKAGEKYLGKTLTFVFNSFIDRKLWDGPGGSSPAGNKLTSTISLTGNENESGELTSLSATKSVTIGETPIGTGRDYFPGLASDQNKFGFTGTTLNFEQHASVSPVEEFGLGLMGFDIVNVAQRLTLGLQGNNLSVTAATDIFPSATLTMNGSQMMYYPQPSFRGTHSVRGRTTFGDNGTGGSTIIEPLRPAPSFYRRFSK